MIELEPKERPGVNADILNPTEEGWNDKVDSLRQALGAPKNPFLFPPHFVKRTLVSIGGSVIEFKDGNELLGAGFIFPRIGENGIGYTLRLHDISGKLQAGKAHSLTEEAIRDKYGKPFPVYAYIPERSGYGERSSVSARDGLSIERTSEDAASEIRNLQRGIWGVLNDDFLYPEDIHTPGFSLPTSLIAYVDSNPVGFLFGFDKFSYKEIPTALRGYIGNSTTRQESQLMGVLPDQRSRGIGTKLKIKQAEQALQDGTEIINWTFDPLVSQNAVLNINILRGIIWEHYPNYYSFSGANKLNQVEASRFSVNWMITSPRVRGVFEDGQVGHSNGRILEELKEGIIPIITSTRKIGFIGGEETRAIERNYMHFVEHPRIAIEIPVNWTTIQDNDIQLAQEWRGVTDDIFQEYVGTSEGKYAITDVVIVGEKDAITRVFLIGRAIAQIDKVFLEKS
ncbi:MAG: hypothetical protein M1444_00775 [Patescibacteria group bacterium]|nr:hypothetical protein [Patescibacteria group bacterium]